MDDVASFIGNPLVVAFAVVLLAATVHSLTGFGFALVMVPILLLLFDAKLVVLVCLVVGTVLDILVLAHSWRQVQIRQVLTLLVGVLVGSPIGAGVLLVASPAAIKFIIGALVVLFSIPLALGYSRNFKNATIAAAGVGLVSGLLNTSTSINGPPTALFMINQGHPKDTFRASMNSFFLLSNAIALPMLGVLGLITNDVLRTSFAVLPAVFLGLVAGVLLLPRVSPVLFRKVTIAIVMSSGIVSLVSGARGV